jgi:uncharacterized repeat protein (TIGR01451 family)
MADPCVSCSSMSNTNICSCPPQNGISVLQQSWQMLIDGNIVNNPCYNSVSGISTWTYKIFADYASQSPINSLLIPVCADIQKASIAVEEKFDGSGRYTIIPFTLNTADPEFGNAPSQFQWLKIDINNRYGRGVYAEYRISIEGNYPVAQQSIMIKSGENNLSFNCQPDGYKVPGCPIPDKLEVDINCDTSISNNGSSLLYDIKVQNKGASTLNNVQYQDIMSYDGNSVNLDAIKISGDTMLQAIPIASNTAIISGIIPSIAPEQVIPINYTIPVAALTRPGTFIFTDMVTAAVKSASASNYSTVSIEAVKLTTSQHFTIANGNEVSFYTVITSVGQSPETTINITVQIMIPSNIVVRFTDFSGCNFSFSGGDKIPLNTNITDATINIERNGIVIPSGGGVRLSIPFLIMSASSFQSPVRITGTLLKISGTNPKQIFLPPSIPSPVSLEGQFSLRDSSAVS